MEYILKMVGREKVVKEDKEKYILHNSVKRESICALKICGKLQELLKVQAK